MKRLILLVMCCLLVACNSGTSTTKYTNITESYSLLDSVLPEYGNCKNEKLCVTHINPKTKNYGNNTLVNIPVGNFGLVGYTVKSQNRYDISDIQISKLPNSQFSIDTYRSTCIGKTLSPQEECNIVIKYQPAYYSEFGFIKFRFETEKLFTPYIVEEYSSRSKQAIAISPRQFK